MLVVGFSSSACASGGSSARGLESLATQEAITCVRSHDGQNQAYIAAAPFRNRSERKLELVAAHLDSADGLTQGTALYLGDDFNFDLFRLPIEDDEVIEAVWRDRRSLDTSVVQPGDIVQVGVPIRFEFGSARGTAGPMVVEYRMAGEQRQVVGTFTYVISVGACNL